MEDIRLERRGHVAILTLNRPEALNALRSKTVEELGTALRELEADREVWVVVVTGAGERAFCVGGDLKERAAMSEQEVERLRERIVRLMHSWIAFSKPMIAAVNGVALGGGCEIALACDLRVASEDARFGLPETRVGVIPGGGGTQLLPRLIGPTKAKEVIFTGGEIEAREAERIGLVNRVVPREEVLAAAVELAERICRCAPIAVRQAKRAIDVGLEAGLRAGLDLEAEAYKVCIPTKDRLEGLRAFKERRAPEFKGE